MISLKTLIKAVAPLALVLSSSAFAQSPDSVTIRSINWAGTGCPAGSVASNVSPDYKAFTLLFDSFVAEIGPGEPLSKSRKNCSINIDLQFPTGWSYTVLDVDYRGYLSIEPGVTAQQTSTYSFQGQFATARLGTTMRGPQSRDYQFRDSLGLSAAVWSPCGLSRTLMVNAAVRVHSFNRSSRGIITLDSVTGQVTHRYGIVWRRC